MFHKNENVNVLLLCNFIENVFFKRSFEIVFDVFSFDGIRKILNKLKSF